MFHPLDFSIVRATNQHNLARSRGLLFRPRERQHRPHGPVVGCVAEARQQSEEKGCRALAGRKYIRGRPPW